MNNEILTKKELADLLKVNKRTVERHLEKGEGEEMTVFNIYKAFRIGKQWRFKLVKNNLTNEAEAA